MRSLSIRRPLALVWFLAAGCAASTEDPALAGAADVPGDMSETLGYTDAKKPAPFAPEIELIVDSGLDFGAVTVGGSRDLSFRIHNRGSATLQVASVAKGASELAIFDDVIVLTSVVPGSAVPPNIDEKDIVVTVRFAPTQKYPATYGPVGFIEVTSDDHDEPVAYIRVLARTAEPKLQITPEDVIDFGIVAPGPVGATRSISFTNVGSGDLEISTVAISANTANEEFYFVSAPELPWVIGPSDYRTVDLRFENQNGPADEIVSGTLSFVSNVEGPKELALQAKRSKVGSCQPRLDPHIVDFGTVGVGFAKTLTVNVTNDGTAACSPFSVNVFDCYGPLGTKATAVVKADDESDHFMVVDQPPAIKDLLQPGQTVSVTLRVAPISASPLVEPTPISALLHVRMLDYANQDGESGDPYTVRSFPPGQLGEIVDCNVFGNAGSQSLRPEPGELAFHPTAVGCQSKPRDVTIGVTEAVQICAIELVGCDSEFVLEGAPVVPLCEPGGGGGHVLEAGDTLVLGVSHRPEDAGKDECVISVSTGITGAEGITIPLEGHGTVDTEQTDLFAQRNGKVDVLLVVDDSASMAGERAGLAANIGALMAGATGWQADYHVGVVTTDMATTNPERGLLQTDGGQEPRFFTNATGFAGLDDTLGGLGPNGSPQGAGFTAAYEALHGESPWSAPPPACASANDPTCQTPLVCAPSVLKPGSYYCSEWNMEFVREDAALELVFVSDKDDDVSSDAQLMFAVLTYNSKLLHSHAIVGDAPDGCSGSAGDAVAGTRYLDAATKSGGLVRSICTGSWSDVLEAIGARVFALETRFSLTRPAISETIAVAVENVPCTSGWEYEEASNSILFDPASPCMPKANDGVSVHYEVICYGP